MRTIWVVDDQPRLSAYIASVLLSYFHSQEGFVFFSLAGHDLINKTTINGPILRFILFSLDWLMIKEAIVSISRWTV